MPRKADKIQVNCGFPPRADPMHQFYIKEAAARGKPLPTHLMDLLDDRYLALSGQESHGIWFPRGWAAPLSSASPVSLGSVHKSEPETITTDVNAAISAYGEEDPE
jgi:hypothetical protein